MMPFVGGVFPWSVLHPDPAQGGRDPYSLSKKKDLLARPSRPLHRLANKKQNQQMHLQTHRGNEIIEGGTAPPPRTAPLNFFNIFFFI